MNLYPLVKPCLFAMDAERAHNLTLSTLDKVHALGLGFLSQEKIARDERIFCGLKINRGRFNKTVPRKKIVDVKFVELSTLGLFSRILFWVN